MFTFTCEKCGGQFYSKVDPSGWRHRICNACSGKPYPDKPVAGSAPAPSPVPVAKPSYQSKPCYNNVQPVQVEKKEFNLDEYISDMLLVYSTLKVACDEQRLTIPEDCICSWTTSIMIQRGRI